MLVELILPLVYPVVLLMLCVALWRYYISGLRDKNSQLPLPPGTVGLPLVGETLLMMFQGWRFYASRKEKYGRIYKTHLMGKPTIRVWGTENIQQILKNEEMLVTMSMPTSTLEIIGKTSLAASTRRDHGSRRARVLKGFSAKAVQRYSLRLEQLIKGWVMDRCEEGNVCDVLDESRKLSFEASASTLLGLQLRRDQMDTLMSNIDVMVANLFTLQVNIPGSGYHKALTARAEVLKIVRQIIKEKQSSSDEKEAEDVMSILLSQEDMDGLQQAELEDSVVESLFASHNGFPSLCCSTLVHLARCPDVVSKLIEEMDKAGLMNPDTSLTLDKIKDLSYLSQVWKEVTRISPPIGGGYRKVIKTFKLEGYQIPAGWTVIYSIRDNHGAEENFPLHADFNPDRWKDVKSDPSWIPFGGTGIRSCVAKRFINTFLLQFIAIAVKHSSWEMCDTNIEFVEYPVLLPKSRLPLVFHERKPTAAD